MNHEMLVGLRELQGAHELHPKMATRSKWRLLHLLAKSGESDIKPMIKKNQNEKCQNHHFMYRSLGLKSTMLHSQPPAKSM